MHTDRAGPLPLATTLKKGIPMYVVDHEGVMCGLIAYFKSEGWTMNLKEWEAEMPSGYGSGPIVVDLNKLADAVLLALKSR